VGSNDFWSLNEQKNLKNTLLSFVATSSTVLKSLESASNTSLLFMGQNAGFETLKTTPKSLFVKRLFALINRSGSSSSYNRESLL
jgi:hypothetical protein